MKKLKQGYLQIYTGNGKGKTTAALGVSLRAIANNMTVFFAQFIKGQVSSEFKVLTQNKNFTHKLYGNGRFIKGKPTSEEIVFAKKGLEDIFDILKNNQYDIVILDEANGAISAGLFSITDLINVIKMRSPQTEIIVTGRNAHLELIEMADLVTEMKEIKHYFSQGVPARVGIEK